MAVLKDPWLAPPLNLACDEGEVHVWLASLEQEPQVVRALHGTLSAEERQRADRFHFTTDRERFVVARGVLRDILGRYLGAAPARIRFSYSQHGKPSLEEGSGDGRLCFNVSHSHGLARGSRGPARAPRGAAHGRLLQLLDAQGGLHQGARRGALAPAAPLQRLAGSGRASRPSARRR